MTSPIDRFLGWISPKRKTAMGAARVRSLSNPQTWQDVIDAMGGYPGGRGSQSLKVSAVFACNDRISKDVASLPLHIMRKNDRGYSVDRSHDQAFIGRQPNPLYTKYTYMYVLNSHINLWGDAFSPIRREGGRPVRYDIWHPKDVKHDIVDGRLYWVNGETKEVVSDEDMIHVMWYTEDGIRGKSVLSYARDTIEMALSNTQMSNELYKNQMWSPGYISYKGELTKDQVETISENWGQNYMGKHNADNIPVLDQGSEFKHFGMSLKDAEYIETKIESVRDIARFFGVPASKVGLRDGNVSYNSLEQENIAYVQDTIQPRVIAWEEELERKALRPADFDNVRFKFNLSSRLRGDSAARSAFYQMALTTGLLSINDALSLEDMNTIGPEGDERYINGASVPLSKLYSGEEDAVRESINGIKTNGHAPKVQ